MAVSVHYYACLFAYAKVQFLLLTNVDELILDKSEN